MNATYQIVEPLSEGTKTIVFKARREDGRPVVIKALRGPHPTPKQIVQLTRELSLTRKASGSGVIEILGEWEHEGLPALVLEDFGGRSLDLVFRQSKTPLDTFLMLAIKATEALAVVHDKRVVHKDLNPSNLVWNANTGELKIIDFGIASPLFREAAEASSVRVLAGTLPYLAPEQSGRMNRVVDYRSDFYALGATFYELLTGRPPFVSEDPLELVHSHIARAPIPPHQLDPEIPELLSRMLLKLLAKAAEDRYQSARGLLADLKDCRAQLQETGALEDFPLGRHDFADRLQIPQRLYGREAEVDLLVAAFERVAKGALELVLVSGPPGIGKTSLVREVHKPIVGHRGHFLSGKFEQFKRDIPYAALAQALRGFFRQLLSDNDAQVELWRRRLQDATEPNAAVLIELLPELSLLIGTPSPIAELPPAESAIRLHRSFQKLIGALAGSKHPLVLFLDDLQWVDRPSVALIESLATDPDARHLLLVGAYRDNEVDEAHPFSLAVREIRKVTPIQKIELGPLGEAEVQRLTADTLQRDDEETSALAKICLRKTGGNPFFLNQFLAELSEEGLVRFVEEERCWRWDLAELRSRQITDNVVEFLAAKISRLEGGSESPLGFAACVGSSFTLEILARLIGTQEQRLLAQLREAQEEGLLVGDVEAGLDAPFRFAHDRIQQAAYSLLPTAERRRIHLALGRERLAALQTRGAEGEESLFEIVNHLCEGATLIDDQQERDRLAELCSRVAAKAKKSAAYQPALRYSEAGLELLGDEGWSRRHELAYALHLQTADLAFSSGDYTRMESALARLDERSHSTLEKIAGLEIRIHAHNARNNLVGAIDVALAGLALLGVEVPREPGMAEIGAGLGATMEALAAHDLSALPYLAATESPEVLAIMRLLVAALAPAYFAAPMLLPILAFELVQRSLADGLAPESSYGFSVHALVLGSVDMLEAAYPIGEMAPRMAERFDNALYANMAVHLFNAHVRFWKESYRASLAPLRQAHQVALELGDLKYAAFSIFMYCALSFYSGRPLREIEEEFRAAGLAIERAKQMTSLHTHNMGYQAVLNLLGKSGDGAPTRLAGPVYDETAMLPLHREANDRTNIFVSYVYKICLAYLFGERLEAHDLATEAAAYLDGAASTIYVPTYCFFAALSAIAASEHARGDARAALLATATEQREKIARWAAFGPPNYAHKLYLVDAELARVRGQSVEALMAYDRAIEAAHQSSFLADEALAQELAGRFHLAEGKKSIARAYITEASYTYQRWGAAAKVRKLSEELGELMPHLAAANLSTTTSLGAGELLDLDTVMKASQAISGELVLERLMGRMMQILIEAAGAERGLLILDGSEGGRVEAEARAGEREAVVGASVALAEHGGVSAGIVSYVLRTNESVVLSDAAQEGAFVRDPYVRATRPRSLLCSPIALRADRGAIYMENNLVQGAFSAERLRILSMLSAQVAISLDNARLYNRLEQKVAERTAALERSNRFIRATFGRYLSNEVVDELLDAPEGFGLGGEKRKVTIMMTDLRGFTSTANKLAPENVVSVINNYLSAMTEVILKYRGTIDEFIGDAVLAIFGAPIFRPSDAERAVACAIEMQLAMQEVNASNRALGLPEVEMGIGLHTAEVVVGNIGSQKRLKYGVVGSGVNLTSRIEGYTVGGQILVSEDTHRDVSAPLTVKSELLVSVKGVDTKVRLYDVVGIGGKYGLALPSDDEQWNSLASPIAILVRPVSGKYVSDDRHPGQISRLGERSAELITAVELEALSNLELRVLDELGQELDGAIYGKVMRIEPSEHGRVALLRFTSLPEAIADHLKARRDRDGSHLPLGGLV